MTTLLLVSGLSLVAVVAFVTFERRVFPPAALFFAAFISNAFLYPALILSLNVRQPNFAYHNFDRATLLATQCYAALILGYCVYFLFADRIMRVRPHPKPFVAKRRTVDLLIVLVVSLTMISALNTFLYSVPHGAAAYLTDADVGIGFRFRFITSQLLIPAILALAVISVMQEGGVNGRAGRWALASFVAVILITLLSFNRHAAAALIFMFGVLYHYRVQRLGVRHVVGAIGILFTLQVFRMFRGLSVGDLNAVVIAEVISSVNVSGIFVGIVTAITGWDTFTNVLDIVPAREAFKYGKTYLDTLVGLGMPRSLGLSSYEAMTPARWYVEMYAPGTVGHGFDFSMLSEAYINFGEAMFVVFVPVGACVAMSSVMIRRSSSLFVVLFALILLESLTFGLRMDSNAVAKAAVYKSLPMILLMYMSSKFAMNRRPRYPG